MKNTRRAIFFFLTLVAAAASLSGCYTLKGVAEGFPKDVSTAVSIAWNSVNKADAWLQQKAW